MNLKYALKSFLNKLDGKHDNCPSCKGAYYSSLKGPLFNKFPTQLRHCLDCGLLYRHPITTESESKLYYELEYTQKGLTTDLPETEVLNDLLKTKFRSSEKDFSGWFPLFQSISSHFDKNIQVLDYGANWGYTVFQLEQLPYVNKAYGYEYSEIRSSFGRTKLGIPYINIDDLPSEKFDVIFSSHVIEHMYNPGLIRKHFDTLLAPGGIGIITCPNGSLSRTVKNPDGFKTNWGSVHPNFISEKYLQNLFNGYRGVILNESKKLSLMDYLTNLNVDTILSDSPDEDNLVGIFQKSH